jgi:hypothetical protein
MDGLPKKMQFGSKIWQEKTLKTVIVHFEQALVKNCRKNEPIIPVLLKLCTAAQNCHKKIANVPKN